MIPDGQHLAGIDMVTFRVCGGALCFWLLSWAMSLYRKTSDKARRIIRRKDGTQIQAIRKKRPQPPLKDIMLLALAGFFGIVCNQCCFTIGLSLTSPIHASIMTTTMPIVTLMIGVVFLHEGLTWKKVTGIALGITGALILILSNVDDPSLLEGNLLGDFLVIGAQCSFAIYLTLFGDLIKRYDTITCMKWMILWAAILITPFTWQHVAALPWDVISVRTWLETGFVVVCGTFIAYIMMMYAQKALRAPVVAMYNYVQPIVACIVSVALGLGVFGWMQAVAIVLVFVGVGLVNASKHAAKA